MKIAAAIAALVAAVAPLEAQQPPDSLARRDSANVVVIPDSLRFFVVPRLEGRAPAGFVEGVWTFEREDLLTMRGLSLGDLLATVPGVIRLRGGDYGAPETVSAFGLAGGEIRVFWDGFEQVPLDGAVTDLDQIGLGGIEEVRVERTPGELRVDLYSQRNFDARPSSLIEAGTGDFSTNFFTGTFIHPRALGGSIGFSLDRVDTNGAGEPHEDGSRTGGWGRYTRHWGDSFALIGEVRRIQSNTKAAGLPGVGERQDWAVRAVWRPDSIVVLHAFTGASSLTGLARTDRLDVDRERSQHGITGDLVRGPVRAHAGFRWYGGPAIPTSALDLSGTASHPLVGGATVSRSRESWRLRVATLTRVTAWTRPVGGWSLFASRESGQRGAPLYPLPSAVPAKNATAKPEPAPQWRLTDRTATRVGATFAWRGLSLSGARVSFQTDSLPLLNLPMDRGGVVMPPIDRTGTEAAGHIPLSFLLKGLAFDGSAAFWDEGARYLPKRSYQGGFVFHNTYLPTQNFEWWWTIGVEGRDPMLVPVGDPELPAGTEVQPVTVPLYQSWYALIQARILSLRLFIAWENFTIRRGSRDFPGRPLPIFRAHYGIRWVLWN